MHPSLHADHGNLSHVAEDEFSGMSGHSGHRKAFDLMVVQLRRNLNVVRVVPQAGAQNDCHLRLKIDLLPEAFIAFQQFIIDRIHRYSSIPERLRSF